MVPHAVMEVDSRDALLVLIRADLGFSIMPFARVYTHVLLGEFSVRRIVAPTIRCKVSLMEVNENELVELFSLNHEMARGERHPRDAI